MTLSLRRRAILSLVLVCLAAQFSVPADRGDGRTDLRIRVVTPYREFSRAYWNVALSAPDFEPQREVAESGRWIVFRKLPSANYSVCVTGVRGRHSCTTVEVPVAVSGSRARLDVDLEAPRANISRLDLRRPASTLASASIPPADRSNGEGPAIQADHDDTSASSAAAGSKQPPNLIR